MKGFSPFLFLELSEKPTHVPLSTQNLQFSLGPLCGCNAKTSLPWQVLLSWLHYLIIGAFPLSLFIICQIVYTYCPSHFPKPLTRSCWPSKSVLLEKTRGHFGIFHAVSLFSLLWYGLYHWKTPERCIGAVALQIFHNYFHWCRAQCNGCQLCSE